MPARDRDQTRDPDRPPPQLPLLERYAHLHPDHGACLMEYVALLAGHRFSDVPGCTQPVLATIARLVNDATSDTARQALARFAPDLAGATTGDAGRDLAADPALIAAALDTAVAHARPGRRRRWLAWRAHRAHRCQQRLAAQEPANRTLTRAGRWLAALLWRRGPAMRALTAAITTLSRLPEPEQDIALRAVLTTTLHTWRAHEQTTGSEAHHEHTQPSAAPPGPARPAATTGQNHP